jgi:hypothetical protein
MGLMAAFMATVAAASKRAGQVLKRFVENASGKFKAAKEKVREYRLFGKDKPKAMKNRMVAQMAAVVEAVNAQLGKALARAAVSSSRLSKYGLVAKAKLVQLNETMARLIPQIRYWLKTGFVASGKIISLHIPELYAIVRGKVGKAAEFGLSWGIRRLRGGFLLATLAGAKNELHDARFAVSAVEEHIELFGKAPRAYAYDRGGWSEKNVVALKKLGIREVGLAPRGKADWEVSAATQKKLVSERAQVEGGIGSIKHKKYGFNRPAARSTKMMGAYGQQAVLGFNLNKMVRELAKRNKAVLVG